MRSTIWWYLNSRYTTTSRILACTAVLLMIASTLIGGSFVFGLNSVVHAQSKTSGQQHSTTVQAQMLSGANIRLETFMIASDGSISHKWSDDDGITWSSWVNLGTIGGIAHFEGTPAIVSDGVGRLNLFARSLVPSSGVGELWYGTLKFDGSWTGWQHIPGESPSGLICISEFDCYEYSQFPSDMAASSWGTGRMEVFINATRIKDDSRALLHTWADNSTFSGHWEVLGTGLMQGSPAAVSWGNGRTDVFVRGGGNELDHKWFANGSWSSGWENLGGTLTSSPSAFSWLPGFLGVAARDANGGFEENLYGQGFWSGWGSLDSNSISSSPAITNVGTNSVHVFALGLNNHLLHRHSSNGSWSNWQDLDPALTFSSAPAAAFWITALPPPPPGATATPVPRPPRCGPTTGRPCPVDP